MKTIYLIAVTFLMSVVYAQESKYYYTVSYNSEYDHSYLISIGYEEALEAVIFDLSVFEGEDVSVEQFMQKQIELNVEEVSSSGLYDGSTNLKTSFKKVNVVKESNIKSIMGHLIDALSSLEEINVGEKYLKFKIGDSLYEFERYDVDSNLDEGSAGAGENANSIDFTKDQHIFVSEKNESMEVSFTGGNVFMLSENDDILLTLILKFVDKKVSKYNTEIWTFDVKDDEGLERVVLMNLTNLTSSQRQEMLQTSSDYLLLTYQDKENTDDFSIINLKYKRKNEY